MNKLLIISITLFITTLSFSQENKVDKKNKFNQKMNTEIVQPPKIELSKSEKTSLVSEMELRKKRLDHLKTTKAKNKKKYSKKKKQARKKKRTQKKKTSPQ